MVTYVDFCNNSIGWFFPLDVEKIWNRSTVPLITWKIAKCNHGDGGDPGIVKLINNGTFDEYINQFSDRLKKFLAGPDGIYGNDDDRRAYIRLGHEMNGNWYSWSTGSTPSEYVLGWHHVYDMLGNNGLDSTRLQWIWSVSGQDIGQYIAEEYWVGENYTHWLGIDAYNWGSSQSWSKWQWPNEVFDNMVGRLRKLAPTKPMSFNEFGTVGVRVGNTTNYFCADELHQGIMIFDGNYGDVIWNNFKVYSTYIDCLQTDGWIEPNITNPRLLTDDQFAGRF